MDWQALGRQEVLMKLGVSASNPLMRGTKAPTKALERGKVVGPPKSAPVARPMPAPPHATSGTTVNPKVAAMSSQG